MDTVAIRPRRRNLGRTPTRAQLYARMVAAVRAWAATIDPADYGPDFEFLIGGEVNLIDVVVYCPAGCGQSVAAFHLNPDDPHREHDHHSHGKTCSHCRGDRMAADSSPDR